MAFEVEMSRRMDADRDMRRQMLFMKLQCDSRVLLPLYTGWSDVPAKLLDGGLGVDDWEAGGWVEGEVGGGDGGVFVDLGEGEVGG